MENDDKFPRIGHDFQNWSDLDSQLRTLDLDVELFRRNNVWIASFVILAGLLKGDQHKRQRYISALSPSYFDSKSLAKYIFEKIVKYPKEIKTIPVPELENWIPEYHIDVWGTSPSERMLYAHQLTLRQILSFNPTEEQVNRAIELRKEKMEKLG